MGIDFNAQNDLEQAIRDRDGERVIYAIAENNFLTTLAPASNLGDECFSDEVVFAVLFNSVTEKQLHTMTDGWFWGHLRAGDRLHRLVNEALEPLPQDPVEAEKKLVKAIVYHDSCELIRLIREEKAMFQGFAPELLTMLRELSKEAVLTFLRDGLSAKLKGIVLRILLKESAEADLLKSFSYEERIKYANLMIRIIAGIPVSADQAWYSET